MKAVFSWISLALVGIVWFAAAGFFALFTVVSPSSLKIALSENNTYQKIVPNALKEAQRSSTENDGGQIPINDPGIQTAVDKAFPANDLQTKSETVIDSMFAWLEGKTSEPEFNLDFTANKQALATEIGAYAETRAASLPPCNLSDLDEARSSNVFTVKCLPPGVTPAQAGREAAAQITNDKEFLKDPIVTPETLRSNESGLNAQQVNAEPLRKFYQNRTLLTWLPLILVVVLSLCGVLLAADKRRAIKALGRIFLVAAVSLALVAIVLKIASGRLSSTIPQSEASSDIVVPIIGSLLNSVTAVYIWFAIVSILLTILLFIVSRRIYSPASSRT